MVHWRIPGRRYAEDDTVMLEKWVGDPVVLMAGWRKGGLLPP
jgi:hypothetical protein